jgi:hypothetical protein
VGDRARAASPEAEARLPRAGWPDVRIVPPGVDALAVATGRPARARERWRLGAGAWIAQLGPTPWLATTLAGAPVAGVLVIAGDPPRIPGVAVHAVGAADVADALAVATLAVIGAGDPCFPVEILAALAAGVPVATETPVALPGVIAPSAIAGLLGSPDGLSALGAAGRAEVVARHTAAHQAAALGRLYAERLGR